MGLVEINSNYCQCFLNVLFHFLPTYSNMELAHSRHTRFPTVPYVAAMRGKYSILRGRNAWQQGPKTPVLDRAPARVPHKPQGCAKSVGKGQGSVTGRSHALPRLIKPRLKPRKQREQPLLELTRPLLITQTRIPYRTRL